MHVAHLRPGAVDVIEGHEDRYRAGAVPDINIGRETGSGRLFFRYGNADVGEYVGDNGCTL